MSRGNFFAEGPGGWPPTGSNPPLTTPFSGPGGGLQDSLVEIPQRLYNQRVNSEITGRPPMSKITRPLLGRFFLCALSLFPLTGCAGEALRTEEPPPAVPLLHLQDHLLPDCPGTRTPGPRALHPPLERRGLLERCLESGPGPFRRLPQLPRLVFSPAHR